MTSRPEFERFAAREQQPLSCELCDTGECEVVEFLDGLATEEERPRSYIINRIIREYAERKGTPLPRKRPNAATSGSSKKLQSEIMR